MADVVQLPVQHPAPGWRYAFSDPQLAAAYAFESMFDDELTVEGFAARASAELGVPIRAGLVERWASGLAPVPGWALILAAWMSGIVFTQVAQ